MHSMLVLCPYLIVLRLSRQHLQGKPGTLMCMFMCMQADVFYVESWRDKLQRAVGVIRCLGAFGSNDFMQKICGDSNITVFNEAAKAGVSRAAFISVHDYKLPGKRQGPHYFVSTGRLACRERGVSPPGKAGLRPG